MTVKTIVNNHKKGWFEMYELQPEDFAMQKQIEQLDHVALDYEARWGIDVLPGLADADMQQKWNRQLEKLNKAIEDKRLNDVVGLIQGTIRGYKALEDHVKSRGYNPNPPDVWDVQHPESGQKYRICKNTTDARRSSEKDVVTYTLQEVARILESQQLVNVIKERFEGSEIKNIKKKEPEPFDFNSPDPDMPEF